MDRHGAHPTGYPGSGQSASHNPASENPYVTAWQLRPDAPIPAPVSARPNNTPQHSADQNPSPYRPGRQYFYANRRRRTGPTVDYGSTLWRNLRHQHRDGVRMEQVRPSPSYIIDRVLPEFERFPVKCITAKHVHSSLNKVKHPINVVKWTPEGRRLITGSSSGEFTLWNGMMFNFETIMTAHESAIRAMEWTHWEDFLVSSDDTGTVKYWQPNFNNVNAFQAHDASVRAISFAHSDKKYVTASEDATIKVWDFETSTAISTMTGHGWDVRTCDWHQQHSLVISGSKDHTMKLWDPRAGKCTGTLRFHKNGVNKVLWEPRRGDCFASCAREPTARVVDKRMMKEELILKGHDRDITTIAWHPIQSSYLTLGTSDGGLLHYLLDSACAPEGVETPRTIWNYENPRTAPARPTWPRHKVPYAHDQAIWTLGWHPIGHLLASGSNDRVTRFWTRHRPGEDCSKDRYHIGDAAARAHGSWSSRGARNEGEEEDQEDDAEALEDQNKSNNPPILPGLPGLAAAMKQGYMPGGTQPQLPGMGAAPPPTNLPPAAPYIPSNPEVARLAAMFQRPSQAAQPSNNFPAFTPGMPMFVPAPPPPGGMAPPNFGSGMASNFGAPPGYGNYGSTTASSAGTPSPYGYGNPAASGPGQQMLYNPGNAMAQESVQHPPFDFYAAAARGAGPPSPTDFGNTRPTSPNDEPAQSSPYDGDNSNSAPGSGQQGPSNLYGGNTGNEASGSGQQGPYNYGNSR